MTYNKFDYYLHKTQYSTHIIFPQLKKNLYIKVIENDNNHFIRIYFDDEQINRDSTFFKLIEIIEFILNNLGDYYEIRYFKHSTFPNVIDLYGYDFKITNTEVLLQLI